MGCNTAPMAVTLMGCSIDALQHQWAEELHGYNHDWDTAWVTLDQILTQLFTLSHIVYFSKDVKQNQCQPVISLLLLMS